MRATIEFFDKLEQEIRSGCTDQHPAEDVATETAQPQENHNIIENMQEEKKEPEDKETQERERLIRKKTFEELKESDDNVWFYLTDNFKLEWIEKIVRRFPEKTQQQELIYQFYLSYNQKYHAERDGNIYEPCDPFSEWCDFSGKVSAGGYLQDPFPELEEHTDEAMMNLLRKYKSDIAQLREALNNALEEDEKDRAIEEKVEEIKSLQAENERLRAENKTLQSEKSKLDDETVRRRYYCEFLLQQIEEANEAPAENKPKICLFLLSFTANETWLPKEVKDGIKQIQKNEAIDLKTIVEAIKRRGIVIVENNFGTISGNVTDPHNEITAPQGIKQLKDGRGQD